MIPAVQVTMCCNHITTIKGATNNIQWDIRALKFGHVMDAIVIGDAIVGVMFALIPEHGVMFMVME